jgi:D-alanine-D-alanine ligase-like ATP-grasp enzyme
MRPRASPTTRILARVSRAGLAWSLVALHLDRRRFRGARSIRVTGGQERTMAAHQAAWYRRMWDEAARAAGATVDELGADHLLIRRDGAETVVSGHRVMLDHPATIALALDKVLVHRLLEARGVPVPEHVELPASELAGGAPFMADGPGEYVVKPADGSGGGAVTPGIRSVDELWRAGMAAAGLSPRVLVERSVRGDEYRLLFLDGRLLDVVRRARPTVRGDGTSTVAELITGENRRRLDDGGRNEVTRLLHIDLDCELTLRHHDLSLRSVPSAGRDVPVKRAVSDNARVDNVTVHDLSSEVVEAAAAAARASRLRLAGVDLVTPDRTRPLGDARGAVLEVNGTPGLHYHYQVADLDQATPVAVPILDALLSAAEPGVQLPESRRRNA